ncbi:MAG: S-layer homology domain-containing protein [Candidatus Margulisbacteria bacterium]|nr:S-layer homology domain-containing protein [Candidatus Margulisiibacteriota bacterium]
MRAISCLLVVVFLAVSAAQAALDISEIGVGARPLGMGKAYVGLADDASAIFMNPAGLAQNDQLNIVSMSGQMLNEVNYIMLGAAQNTPIGKFGVGYVNAGVGSIPLTRLTGSGSSLEVEQYDTASYSSSQIILSYGSKLNRFMKNGFGQNIYLGLNLKFLQQGFSGGGTTMQGASGSGMDADLGAMWEPNNWLSLGLNLQNFLPASFGGQFTWTKNSVVEGIPLVVRLGSKFSVLGTTGLKKNVDQRLDLMVDYEKSNSLNRPGVFHLGVEYAPLEMISLRAGIDQKPKATETGIGVDNNLTAGVGFLFAGFAFDYAYHQFGDLSENSSHFFSIGYRGAERGKERNKERAKAEKRQSTIPVPEVVVAKQLKSFPDVPSDYWAQKPIEYLATLNIMDGYSDGMFKPTKQISRGEMAVLLVKAKGFSVGQEIKVKFSDVSLQSYEAPYVSLAVERKYIEGFPDGSFEPDQRITRAEAASIMARFCGLYQKPKLQQKPYVDVKPDHWAAPAIAADKAIGLFEYIGGKAFGPNLYLTRAEAAEMISKTPFAKEQIKKLISEQSAAPVKPEE